jgi:hypothetical protein
MTQLKEILEEGIAQKIYDRVAEHLLGQMDQAKSDGGSCLYKTPDGKSCAVGCLSKDEFYSPSLEHQGAENEDVLATVALSLGVPQEVLPTKLLTSLQVLHDTVNPRNWPKALAELASINSLRPVSVKE